MLPDKLKPVIMFNSHNSVFSGHLGKKKTISRIKKIYFWPTMVYDITNWIKNCSECQFRKSKNDKIKIALKPLNIPHQPFDQCSFDILGPLPISDKGNKYILVFVDHLMKWSESFALPNQTAETIAKTFVEEIICRFCLPRVLISDQGTNFLSDLLEEVNKLFLIDKRQTSAYHPECN